MDATTTTPTRWVKGKVSGIVVYAADYPSRAVISQGIDGGWVLDRDVLAPDLDDTAETFATVAEAMAAAG